MTNPAQTSTAPMLVKIGGAAIDDPARADALWLAIAEARQALGGRLLLVHGGGLAVDRHLARLGLTSERRDGIRLTPPDQIWEVVAVLAGRVNKAIVGALHRNGVPAVGLFLGDGGLLRTAKAETYPFDPGRVGTVTGGDPSLARTLLDAGYLPVLSSVGLDADGEPLNINADDAAAGVARVVGASRLVLLTDVPGVLDAEKRRIDGLTTAEAERLIADGTIHGGMIPKVRAAVAAAEAAAIPAVIASWNNPADLVRLARGQSAGTSIAPCAAADHARL